MESDRVRWDERYRDRTAPEPHPPDVLVDHPELLDHIPTTGRALDVACGLGAQSLWLADRGLSVLALDVSRQAIEVLRGATDRRAVEARQWDTDDGLPPEAYDFDVIVCQRFRSPDLYERFVERLRPGGVLILTVLSVVGDDTDDPTHGSGGPFHAPRGELTSTFGSRADVEILVDDEAAGTASVMIRRIR